ncbi:MAG: hypothetical protein DRI90_19535 [Deltaproteobacteria bacterium]|nr:MAG: hypothetical protein DRI90_19535 [Deltaproteobacteria bacterium]
MNRGMMDQDEMAYMRDLTLTINAMFGWDFNSCECLRKDGIWQPIDFANPCPDSQVTSLHYHFPWMIMANIRWSVFAAASRMPMKPLTWNRFFDAVEEGMTVRERLDALVAIAHERFQTEEFEDFCATHLQHLDEVTLEFFGSDAARDAVHQKVAAMFPPHEVEEFTELFVSRIHTWVEHYNNDSATAGEG